MCDEIRIWRLICTFWKWETNLCFQSLRMCYKSIMRLASIKPDIKGWDTLIEQWCASCFSVEKLSFVINPTAQTVYHHHLRVKCFALQQYHCPIHTTCKSIHHYMIPFVLSFLLSGKLFQHNVYISTEFATNMLCKLLAK